jgi:hypothetical protein
MMTLHTILAGDEGGLIRVENLARILAVPMTERGALLDWIEDQNLWHERPFNGPLALRPEAGTVSLDRLRAALRATTKGKGKPLPFSSNLEAAR